MKRLVMLSASSSGVLPGGRVAGDKSDMVISILEMKKREIARPRTGSEIFPFGWYN